MTNWIHFATSWGHHKTSLVCFPHSPLLYEKCRGEKKQERAEKPSKAEIDEKIWRFWTGTCGFCGEPRMAEKQLHVYSLLFFCEMTLGCPNPGSSCSSLGFFYFLIVVFTLSSRVPKTCGGNTDVNSALEAFGASQRGIISLHTSSQLCFMGKVGFLSFFFIYQI